MTAKEYFHEHGINATTGKKFGLYLKDNDTTIVIPIRDENGTTLYNKYRHLNFDPGNPETSKYSFDPGNNVSLFNLQAVKDRGYVIICEGEMDCMRLDQEGLVAVTSTGGAKSFKEDWIDFLHGKTIFINLDNDQAGIEATRKLLDYFPDAKVVDLPQESKDICEYFQKYKLADYRQLLKEAKEKNQWLDQHAPEKFQVLSVEELFAIQYPDDPWLVEKFIPNTGFVLFVGESGVSKSYLSLHLAKCLQTGDPFINEFKVNKKVPVLIIDKENGLRRLQKRLRGLGVPEDAEIYMLKYPELFRIDDAEFMESVRNLIIYRKIGLVILDSFVDLMIGNENSAGDTTQVFDAIRSISTDVVWTGIHHESKPMPRFQRTAGQRTRGSSNIIAQVDASFNLEKTKQTDLIYVEQAKARDFEPIKKFAMQVVSNPETGELQDFKYLGEAVTEVDKINEIVDWILDYLEHNLPEAPQKELIEDGTNHGFDEQHIKRAIKVAKDNNLIASKKHGNKVYLGITVFRQQKEDDVVDEAVEAFSPNPEYNDRVEQARQVEDMVERHKLKDTEPPEMEDEND